MSTVDPAILAEKARNVAAKLRTMLEDGDSATLLLEPLAALFDTLAQYITQTRNTPTPTPTSEPRPFKVGDRVRIARKFEGSVEDWWWIAAMDCTLGRVGTILNTPKDATASMYVVGFEDDALGWVYPFGSLDLLSSEDGQ